MHLFINMSYIFYHFNIYVHKFINDIHIFDLKKHYKTNKKLIYNDHNNDNSKKGAITSVCIYCRKF